MNDGPAIEGVSIPSDHALAGITEFRTEIVSVKGADVFIMPCSIATENKNSPVLFSDPEKLMRCGMFLPLDDYIKEIFPNDENGVTAYVALYAALNCDTEYPEQAFSFVPSTESAQKRVKSEA